MKKLLLTTTLLGAVASFQVNAAITAIGPFTGTMSESFESFNGYVQPSGNASIMGGAATFATDVWALSTVGGIQLSMFDSGIVTPSSGIKAAGMINYPSKGTILFASSIYAFGGYWGVPTSVGPPGIAPDPGSLVFTFYDNAGQTIGTSTVSYSHTSSGDGGLDWYGWISTLPIKKVEFQNGTQYQVMMDGLQASTTPVPEPSTYLAGMSALGMLCLFGRRNRK